ncbi:MAG: DUF1585 domain-containing protein, partial [Myxococcales bacterium]|nr:DUF1585 domain-containing protein [Myxococcales bacterium]
SGEWVDLSGNNEPVKVNGAAELGRALADDPRVHRCVTRKWFQYAMGRTDDEYDRCSVDTLSEIATAGSVQDVILAVVLHDQFRFRTIVEPSGGCE